MNFTSSIKEFYRESWQETALCQKTVNRTERLSNKGKLQWMRKEQLDSLCNYTHM